ncbi:NAD(P)/FAD-dependent oxidoreductase [Bordetella hinzii]|uniref:Rhodocoxin reductase n=1 Tax=Bordetella hinzii OH87 BAL007II TaxID=1331262 RepID=A0ABR4R062_9BORD|nr:FAD-dependent oxidoreductase [Bordetella hinzii]KCB23987.1 putative rhodocoxin reductase [Bordetella hinzii OH87 BAL007II]KCB45898.1 putative rhodocoxin reductase [Bordetella hinzii 5132]QDJ41550.1 ferredoxin reductase [Bordetella hinzii]QDJ46104.1 ferredoxin reductase [Bordetella hinzii]QDJ55023.1 ferredoxin reductase [Bordetella hinzii]
MRQIVIIGGGHAAAQLCGSLAEAGPDLAITLISEEAQLPYHRPPLSKTFIKDAAAEPAPLRPASAYEGVRLLLGETAVAIDPAARTVTLASGASVAYDELVLATGTRARRLPALEPAPANLHYLRTAADARRLRDALARAGRVTVLGGGFIGLEIAATAAALGKQVEVFESQSRLLARSVSPEISERVAANLREAGIALRLDASIESFDLADGRVGALRAGGRDHPVELLVAGIGAVPETRLAEAAGLAVDNGIVVDSQMRTSAPHIHAIGDCTAFPYLREDRRLRLESVQNANDQARTLAAVLCGQPADYRALPWFWSDQGALRLQIAGIAPAGAERRLRPGSKPGSLSVMHFLDGRLVCVESINAPLDHMAARKLLELAEHPPAELLLDPSVALKTHC